ncbi:hypothetical protein DAEQUDRAFT_324407 [Daedalea quercina L-15889]|uniref:Uncharacterized protein n=1 Tax=Daedalea quercina L-15889 TaxID=1314783 RepID=A0A165PTS3_9APHY|nr:hypothetical protein DAEQUDRAFT_324407 [Daedalea quercina L-15889]
MSRRPNVQIHTLPFSDSLHASRTLTLVRLIQRSLANAHTILIDLFRSRLHGHRFLSFVSLVGWSGLVLYCVLHMDGWMACTCSHSDRYDGAIMSAIDTRLHCADVLFSVSAVSKQ